MSATTMPIFDEADQLLDLLENGVFNALLRGVLHAVQFTVITSPNKVLESYTFTVGNFDFVSPHGDRASMRTMISKGKGLIRRLRTMCSENPPLPNERSLGIHVFYTPECPGSYDMPGFADSRDNTIEYPRTSYRERTRRFYGSVDSGFHTLGLRANSLLSTSPGGEAYFPSVEEANDDIVLHSYELNPNFHLLLDACGAANIDVVRFILDSHDDPENPLPLGSVDLHQRDDSGDTPILAAAGSLIYPDEDADEAEDEGLDRNEWIRNRITRSHQLINFLLDRGCSATDVNPPLPNDLSPWGNQVQGSVIGLSVSTGTGPLIQRLLDSGADIYLKHQHLHHPRVPLQSSTTDTHTHDVTTLHLTSLFYNSDAVKLLLNHQNHKANGNPDLTSSCDSDGRSPLHWAASGSAESDCRLLDKQLKITETLRLLLDHDSTGINLVDKTGSTPLHYAARSHARCGCTQYAELAIRNLLEYKADPRIPDGSGRTILHLLGYHSHQGDPINTTLLESILSHGANINHTENNGKTALHVFAQNLRQVSAAKFLIEHGADFRARNALRETPFHAAARGFLNDHVRRDGRDTEVTTANKIRLQDEIMLALNNAAGEDAAMLMNQPNAEDCSNGEARAAVHSIRRLGIMRSEEGKKMEHYYKIGSSKFLLNKTIPACNTICSEILDPMLLIEEYYDIPPHNPLPMVRSHWSKSGVSLLGILISESGEWYNAIEPRWQPRLWERVANGYFFEGQTSNSVLKRLLDWKDEEEFGDVVYTREAKKMKLK
ncbi:hypothetical protein PENSOL_c003G03998 [Penicillium solitum]|uniref:HORMA domain-containing protein n=1 Tax=Penicillium solitum TaxID=60172 RepID=A0A1V6RJS1_9EURO|nr:uncharacterized protein PENSOL_c003G03998 [Penicillium solitum]OQE02092.1 hypothetical protein PENSOL_c003G03998 [Penicillium solitum]